MDVRIGTPPCSLEIREPSLPWSLLLPRRRARVAAESNGCYCDYVVLVCLLVSGINRYGLVCLLVSGINRYYIIVIEELLIPATQQHYPWKPNTPISPS